MLWQRVHLSSFRPTLPCSHGGDGVTRDTTDLFRQADCFQRREAIAEQCQSSTVGTRVFTLFIDSHFVAVTLQTACCNKPGDTGTDYGNTHNPPLHQYREQTADQHGRSEHETYGCVGDMEHNHIHRMDSIDNKCKNKACNQRIHSENPRVESESGG